MRENRTYGSEGGEAETNRPSLPLSFRFMQNFLMILTIRNPGSARSAPPWVKRQQNSNPERVAQHTHSRHQRTIVLYQVTRAAGRWLAMT